MKKIVKNTLIALPVVLAVLLLIVFVKIGNMVKSAVLTIGPEVLQAPVELDDVSVRPLRGQACLKGLRIGNPEGFRTPNAITLAELRIDVDIRSIGSDIIRVHGIYIDAPDVTLEGLRADNLKQLQENALTFAGQAKGTPRPDTGPPTGKPADPQQTGKKYVIDELVITAGKISYSPGLTLGQALAVNVPEVRLEHLGDEESALSLAQALETIFEKLEVVLFGTAVDLDDAAARGAHAVIEKGGT